jgi:hypothetical protein
MNNERRRTHDLELLSTYLDSALNAEEKQHLEARLSREPQLQVQLENLRKTKVMVGHLTRLHAPRNFTLTPEMVKVRRVKKQPLFTTLKLASSFAAILLVALFGVQLFIGRNLPFLPNMQSEPVQEAARISDDEAPEPLILWAQPGGVGGGGAESDVYGMGGGAAAMEGPTIQEEAISSEPEISEEASPPEDLVAVPEEEIASEALKEADSFSAEDQDAEGKTPILGINTDAAGEIIDRSEPSEPASNAILWQRILRWSQIALAVIALGGGFTLLMLHIQRRRSS